MRTFSIPSRYFAEDDTRSTFRWITQARASSYLAAPLSTNSCFGVTINSLVTRDQVEVCPLSRGVMLPYGRRNPYPTHYRLTFASSTILYPQSHRLALRLAFPKGENYGLTTFRSCTRTG